MSFANVYQFVYVLLFPFRFEGGICDWIVCVPDHCLSFYFASSNRETEDRTKWKGIAANLSKILLD